MARWPHAPVHRLGELGAHIVTASTYHKHPHFQGFDRLAFLHDLLLEVAERHSWRLQAWAVFPNHYHFIAAPEEGSLLSKLIQELHSRAAIYANRLDGTSGRMVWHQYWETHLTFEKSYLARLKYVNQNPVRHKVVTFAEDYPFCSAKWFAENSPRPFVETVASFKIDRVQVPDDF